MQLTLPVVLWTTFFAAAPPQDEKVQWLAEHAIPIQSIDPDDDEDFSDLEPLKKLIGESRIVVLGEQSHGDGAVFYAKARLIKFLHQQMGFDVLAWESGLFDCREFDRALKDDAIPMNDVLSRGVFPIWTQSAQVMPTLEYVRQTLKTDKPIETAGFDHQFSAGGPPRWPAAIRQFMVEVDPTLVNEELRASLRDGFERAFAGGRPERGQLTALIEQWKKIPPLLDQHRDALIARHGESEFNFMRRSADDAVIYLEVNLTMVDDHAAGVAKKTNARDDRMGRNLAWLANERYPNRKIIVWAATFHAVYDIQKISGGPDYKGVMTCGQVAHDLLGKQMYSIGFTACDGKAGIVFRPRGFALAAPSVGSLEDLCRKTNKPFLLIDFRSLPDNHWLRDEMTARPLGYAEMKASWPRQMDAMYYIQTMFPSTRENALPPYAQLRIEDK